MKKCKKLFAVILSATMATSTLWGMSISAYADTKPNVDIDKIAGIIADSGITLPDISDDQIKDIVSQAGQIIQNSDWKPLQENGKATASINIKANDDKSLTFTYKGKNKLIRWEFGTAVENTDYTIVSQSGNQVTVKLLQLNTGFVVNAITEANQSSSSGGSTSSTTQDTTQAQAQAQQIILSTINKGGNTTAPITVAKPYPTAFTKVTPKKKAMVLKWRKITGITGYQIQIATDKKFKKNKKTYKVAKPDATKKTIKKLKSGKKYYVRIRTYSTINKKTTYATWSKVKNVKVK